MSSARRTAFASAALLACLSTAAFAEYGRTAGSFSVSNGAATYTIPIWTPPGPNGLTPSIALTYSSDSGNGVGGVGWQLSAASAIVRCERTVNQDGAAGAVDLTMNDRYCIGGNRLRKQSGTYGVANSVYYTEFADYSRITAYGTAGNGPQYFIVEAKNGLKYEYGATTSSRVLLGSTALRWMLNKVYDRNGNNYLISYNNTGGFAVPDVISWTPTYLGSTSYRYEAKFNYLTSRADEDSYLGKVAGYDVTNRYRLENIQIRSAGVVKRKYVFGYDTSPTTSRSRLTSAKECADDAATNCLLPIAFTYQAGQAGTTTSPISGPSSVPSLSGGKLDFNGDGKSDLLYVSGGVRQVAFSTGSGFTAPVSTGVASSAPAIAKRFLASQQDGLLVNNAGTWNYVAYNGTSFVTTSTGIPAAANVIATDNNGDGLSDLMWLSGTTIMVRLNTSTGAATVPSFGSALSSLTFNVGQGNVQLISPSCPRERMCDVNGDGRGDFIVDVLSVTNCGMSGCTVTRNINDILANGSGYTLGAPAAPIAYQGLKFNDDKCIDRVYTQTVTTLGISGCNGGPFTGISLSSAPLLTLDWNGDGNTDIVVNSGGFLGVYLSRGNAAAPLSSLIPTSIPYSTSCSYFYFDVDGDGFDDIGCVGTSAPNGLTYYTHNGSGGTYLTQEPDLLSSATDGFGVTDSPSYVSTSQNNYIAGTGTQLPLVNAVDPITVVAQVTSSDGTGGTYTKTYSYVGARINAARSEFAGFQRIDEIDSRNSVITRTYFDQTFPVTGMVSQQEIMQPNGVTPISRVVNTNTFDVLDSTTANQRYFTYPQGSTATQYEVGSAWNGTLLRSVATSNVFDNSSGTLYDQTVTTTEPASGANGFNAGGVWTHRTYSPFANLVNDSPNWCLGRPGKTQQINSHTLTYGSSITRTTDITWNAALCRPTQVVEEDGSSLEVTTDIGYDSFGNVVSSTVSGAGIATRTTTAAYSNGTYTTGQFPLSVTNALTQTSASAWNYDLGVPTSVTDPNGLSTSWQYDAFGRRIREDLPDGTYNTWGYHQCVSCNPRVKIYVDAQKKSTTGSAVTIDQTYLDQFDRAIYEYSRRHDGNYNITTRNFDALGRVAQEYFPFISTGSADKFTAFAYDLANRVTQVSRPISDTNPTLQYSYSYYEGLTTRTVDAENKQSSKTINALGEIVRSTDHDNYYQAFEYDAFGAVKRVIDSVSGTTYPLQTSTYNIRGMLTARTDMDMGAWTFAPNALGEVVSQTDAKSQTTTFVFDLLGRLTSRTEAEGTSTWTWGNSSAAKNIGRLASVSGPGYSESYTYDSIGRPSSTSISADTSYQIDYAYNNSGALDTLTYPTSTASYRLKLQYEYQNGFLHRIKDFNAPTTVFWAANTFNSRNQTTQETLGNGLVTNRNYDIVAGTLKSIQTGLGGGSGVQNLAYEWDRVGNLKQRRDVNQSNLTEAFTYDNLHRLSASTLNTVPNLSMAYDAMGNITNKSDVGAYTYHSTKKHQVVSTSNGWTFSYDNNGNMTSGRNATITWTSYNYPASIVNGSDTSSFSYTPDRQHWRQISNYTSGGAATTIYVGGILEKVTNSAGTDYKHFVRAPGATVIISRRTDGQNVSWYNLGDHLGSNSTVTTSTGAVQVALSYDAYGKRRGSSWAGSPSAGDWANIAGTTRRGYTDHSMLDNLNLIHMNGRIQDPQLGRFVSADPFITEPMWTQNYNRYSYLYNNPLSFTDPSGFGCENVNGNSGSSNPSDDDVKESDGYKNGSTEAGTAAEDCMQEQEVTGRRGRHGPSPQPPSRQSTDQNPPKTLTGPAGGPDIGGTEGEPFKDRCTYGDGTEVQPDDTTIVVGNDRNESVDVTLNDVNVRVSPNSVLAPQRISPGDVNFSVRTSNGSDFSGQLNLQAGLQYDFRILSTTESVFRGANIDIAKEFNRTLAAGYNEFLSLTSHDLTFRGNYRGVLGRGKFKFQRPCL